MSKGDEADATQYTVHEVDEGALAGAGEADQENGDERGYIQVLLLNSTGGKPEVTGAVAPKLVPEIVERLRGDEGQPLHLAEQPYSGAEIGDARGHFESTVVILELRRGSPPGEERNGVIVLGFLVVGEQASHRVALPHVGSQKSQLYDTTQKKTVAKQLVVV